MVIMAAMLPGVECARRRRLRQGGGAEAAEAGGGARRSSFCVHGGAATVGNSKNLMVGLLGNNHQQRSGVMELIHSWSLDSNAREAKERLDQKLRNQREAVIKRHHSTGSMKLNRATASGGGGGDKGSSTAATATAAGVQREVYSRKGVMRRLMRWSRLRWDAAEQAECAVCLEEFAAGDVLAHLPCGHRFHWGCALPWLEAAASRSSCPFCRAAVDTPATPPACSSIGA
uniref:RING-type domain-containing protein n=1 Tax=Leersia perrieri TaxID=77586 RepID=A0A0D9WMJ8_9ORYZ